MPQLVVVDMQNLRRLYFGFLSIDFRGGQHHLRGITIRDISTMHAEKQAPLPKKSRRGSISQVKYDVQADALDTILTRRLVVVQ